MADRLPFHARALELFKTGHYDTNLCRVIAADEYRLSGSPGDDSDGAERQLRPTSSPPGRMVGEEASQSDKAFRPTSCLDALGHIWSHQ